MKKVLLIVFGLFLGLSVWGQNAIVGFDFSDGWGSIDCNSMNANNFEHLAQLPSTTTFIKIDNSDITGEAFFRFGVDWSGTYKQLTITHGLDESINFKQTYNLNTNCTTSGAIKFNANTSYKYVFKTLDAGTNPTGKFVVFEVQGDVRTISNVTNPITIGPGEDYPVTATLDGALNTGQGVYLRYSTDNFTTSTVVSMAHDSGNDYTGSIPSAVNIQGTTVKYYVFTSGDNLVFDGNSPNPSVNDADLYTINLNNNGGLIYSYHVNNVINWCGLVSPTSGTITMGQDFDVETQVLVTGLTNASTNAIDEITCWIGYSASNTNPNTWTNWVQATYNANVGNNDKYKANLKDILPNSASMNNPDFYFASRFQLNNGSYYYGGTGGFWSSDSGSLDVQPINLFGDATSSSFVDMYSSDGKTFSVTTYLSSGWVKVQQNHAWSTNWGSNVSGSNFPSGTIGTNNINVTEAGTYLVVLTFNSSTDHSGGTYSFSNINCTSTVTKRWNGAQWTKDGDSSDHTAPGFDTKAIIEGSYNTSTNGSISTCECEINNGITVTVADNTYFTVAKQIDNDGTIIVENTGNVIQYESSNTNIGDGIYQVKKTAPDAMDYDYIYWSSPLSNADLTTVFAANAQSYIWEFMTGNYIDLFSGTSYPQLSGSAGDGYDDDGNDWRRLTTTGFNNGSTIMDEAKGYIVLVKGSETNPFDFANMEVNDGQDVVFTGGVFNNGTITYSAVQDGITGPDEKNNNLNLIGNPYPSAISADRFLAANSNIGSLYFWTHVSEVAQNLGPNAYDFNNDDYAQYTSAGGVASSNGGAIPTGNIASCQGFMASVADGFTGNITFNNLMRLSVNNNNFYRQANTTSDKDKIWLNLNGIDVFRQILVAFMPETTDQFDFGYDSNRLYDIYTDDFYSVLEDKRLAIQSLASFNDEIEVPLGLKIQNTGNFSISLDHTQGIFSQTQKIYLEDTQEEIIHNLGEGAYTFTQTAGTDINDRFILRFTNTQLGHEETILEDLKLYPNPTKGLLNIAYTGSEPLQITLYNQVGHTVGTYEGVQVLDLSQLAQGMYFAKIANSQGSVTRKIVLE